MFEFRGITREQIVERYRQLISTTPKDLLALCDAIERTAEDNCVCVVAGRDQLEPLTDTLERIITV